MDLSIIIINYNSQLFLNACLNSIGRSNPKLSFEIIVVDNNSKQRPDLRKCKKDYPKIPLVQINNTDNKGYGCANNQAVKRAKGTYLLFLNVDTEVLEQAIDSLYSFITSR